MSERLDESIFGGGDVADERGHYHRTGPRRRRGSARRWLTLLVALGIFAGGAYAAKGTIEPIWAKITNGGETDYPGPGTGEVQVVIKAGQDGEAIATTLKAAGVVRTRTAYLDVARANDKQAAAIQPGTYTMRKEMAAKDAFAFIADPANRVAQRVTVREGLWVSEIYPILSRATGVPLAQYTRAARTPAALGLPAQAKGNLEGWLFPSTYEFAPKSTAAQQLAQMVKLTKSELAKAQVSADRYQHILTVASIVEGEARASADLGRVARVIENRLADPTGPTVGFLQMDSTVNYAIRKRGILTRPDFERAKASPYDTYAAKGLPPGPIGAPGARAIAAAARPTPGPWLYFVTVNLDTGQTKFATTQPEHDALVAELNAWCSANQGKCTGR